MARYIEEHKEHKEHKEKKDHKEFVLPTVVDSVRPARAAGRCVKAAAFGGRVERAGSLCSRPLCPLCSLWFAIVFVI
jgi:hypothetical protein